MGDIFLVNVESQGELTVTRQWNQRMFVPLSFACLGLVLLIYGYQLYQAGKDAELWPSTIGEVTYFDIKMHAQEGLGTYELDLRYRYRVDDIEYVSDRISFGGMELAYVYALKTLPQYPLGKMLNVYYNPLNPEDSVLKPGAQFLSLLLYCLGVPFFSISGACAFALLFFGREFSRVSLASK